MRVTWTASSAIAAGLACWSCSPSSAPTDAASSAGSSGGGQGGSGGQGIACDVDCDATAPPCMVGFCDQQTGECDHAPGPDGLPCDDGQFCTVDDTCQEGVCEGGAENDCGMAGTDCTIVLCAEGTRSCGEAAANNGAACIGEDKCILNGHCNDGACIGTTNDCFFAPGGECNDIACNPATGECEATPNPDKNGEPCSSSGDLCSVGKTCTDGACLGGAAKDCSALTAGCIDGICSPATGQCVGQQIAEGQPCLAATDACNVGICSAMSCIPMPTNEGNGCEDGDSCTLGETCASGLCQGGSTAGYVEYFAETFADNSAGWTLGPEWEIGAAQASGCAAMGTSNDPANDVTPTADNGVAGVEIGGCAETALHGFRYLESPSIDTDVEGPVWLELWRFLNSDYAPFMTNVIEVFDGNGWVTIWQSLAETPEDASWQHVSHDLTAYKSATMKVRFGFAIGVTGVASVSSWNIDDVTIANQVCN